MVLVLVMVMVMGQALAWYSKEWKEETRPTCDDSLMITLP